MARADLGKWEPLLICPLMSLVPEGRAALNKMATAPFLSSFALQETDTTGRKSDTCRMCLGDSSTEESPSVAGEIQRNKPDGQALIPLLLLSLGPRS